MRFARTRVALQRVRSATLRRDLEDLVAVIERTSGKDRKTAGRQASVLMNMTVRLGRTLPHRTRLAIVDAAIDDATKATIPHQWERKKDHECGPANTCRPKEGVTCRRDTSGTTCYSG